CRISARESFAGSGDANCRAAEPQRYADRPSDRIREVRMRTGRLVPVFIVGVALGVGTIIAVAQSQTAPLFVLTQHNDNNRSGANLQESILTVKILQSGLFGLLFSWPVDGQVYGQPLYLGGVQTAGGLRNVVFIVTEHNSVYAFDGDRSDGPIWQTNLGASI